ncbi:MAG: lipopolysaccharide biosynthesis protein [Planctomycetia bacterium]|nr:lipopolysaccharide biosynthesis protein [Planctomycetia bacterium]
MTSPDERDDTDRLSASFSAEHLRTAVRRGSRRTILAQAASHVVSLVVLATLMRLVDPANFGLIAMAMPVVLLLRIFTSLGLNVATVQSREVTPALVSTLFWLQLALAAAMAVVALALAPAMALLYRQPEVAWVTAALALLSVATALGLQHIALLERNLRLGRAALARLGGQITGGVAGIAVALAGHGVWALVAQQYVEMLALAAIAWQLEPWRPGRPRIAAPMAHALRLGGYFTASSLVFYLMGNVDKVLVGVALGEAALGLYSQAFSIMMKPVLVLTTPLTSLMLPALSRSAHDRASYRGIVLAFQRLLAVASFPAGVGLLIVAPEAMLALGGSHWADAGYLLSALAVTILAQGFINMAGSIFVSAGRWRAMFVGSIAMVLVLTVGVLIGLFAGRRYGWPALGVACGFSLTTCLAIFLPYMLFCLRNVGVPRADWARQLWRPALAAMAMGAIVFAARGTLLTTSSLSPASLLGVEVTVGVAAYALFAWRDLTWCWNQLRGS